MARLYSLAKLALGLIGIAAAIVGWTVAILQDRWLDDLEAKLADARQTQTPVAETQPRVSGESQTEASAPEGDDEERQEAMTSLAQLKAELKKDQETLASLKTDIDVSTAELARLDAEIEGTQAGPGEAALAYRTRTRARVRADPTTDAPEVAVVSADRIVEVSGSNEDETWYRVTVTGYMFHELLNPNPEP